MILISPQQFKFFFATGHRSRLYEANRANKAAKSGCARAKLMWVPCSSEDKVFALTHLELQNTLPSPDFYPVLDSFILPSSSQVTHIRSTPAESQLWQKCQKTE